MSYSATIDLQLTVNGQDYELGQVGPADVILREPSPVAFPAGTKAILTITVDGRVRAQEVILPEGLEVGQRVVRYGT